MNSTIEELSQILDATQTQLQQFGANHPNCKHLDKHGGCSNPGNCLLDVLTEWSQQLFERCQELQTSSHPHEVWKASDLPSATRLKKNLRTFHDNFATYQKCGEIMEDDLISEKTSTKNGPSSEEKTNDHELSLEINNLQAALESASRRIQEEAMTILSLKQRLQVQPRQFYQVMEDHEKELQSLSHLYSKLNSNLSNDVNHTKSTLVELQTRYNYLILTLDNLLGEAGKRVVDLRKSSDLSKVHNHETSNSQQYERANEIKVQEDLQKGMDLSKLYDGRPSNREQDERAYRGVHEMHNQGGLQNHSTLTSPMGMDLPMLNDGAPSHDGRFNEKEIQRNLNREVQMNMELSKLRDDVKFSNMENYKQIEGLRRQLAAEANAHQTEKLKLTSSIKELNKELRNRQQKITELVTMNEELGTETQRLRNILGVEVNEHDENKFRFTNSIKELRKEIQDQNSQIEELSRINEELVEDTKSKEAKIRRSQQIIKTLEHNLARKSKEASKFSKEVTAARTVVSSNRKQCKKLRRQLEQCKKELSRYVVEGMACADSATG